MGVLTLQLDNKPVRVYIYKNNNEYQIVLNIKRQYEDKTVKVKYINFFEDEIDKAIELLTKAREVIRGD